MIPLIQDERLRLGAIVLGILFSIAFVSYSIGVYLGSSSALEKAAIEESKLVIEISGLKEQLKKARAEKVQAVVKGSGQQVIDCQATCAKEVNAALDVTAELLCQRFEDMQKKKREPE